MQSYIYERKNLHKNFEGVPRCVYIDMWRDDKPRTQGESSSSSGKEKGEAYQVR